MMVAKRKKGKVCENRTKEGLRTSGKTNSPPGNPVYIGQAQGKEEKQIKRGTKIELLSSFGSACPHASRMFSFACQIKLSCNTGPSVASNFCCSETESRKLQTSQTYMML